MVYELIYRIYYYRIGRLSVHNRSARIGRALQLRETDVQRPSRKATAARTELFELASLG